MYEDLIDSLRTHVEWARANEWESPITLGDDLEEAANALEKLTLKTQASDIEALIKNARVCCGDVEIDEEKEDCGDYCIDSRDCRGTEIRWCRQWLIHDLCEAIEALQAKVGKAEETIDEHAYKVQMFPQMYEENQRLQAENAQLRRERDAAVRDLESVATDTHAKDKAVTLCRYHTDKGCCCYDNYKKVRDCPGWEWRGPAGDSKY